MRGHRGRHTRRVVKRPVYVVRKRRLHGGRVRRTFTCVGYLYMPARRKFR